MTHYDIVILGAGAAGLMAAIEAGRRGRSVLVIDHATNPGEKIRISGGGRCNFTNRFATIAAGRERFLSQNPRFALSALSRYTPEHFITKVDRAKIPWHEKALGQLFCDGPATQIVFMLTQEAKGVGAELQIGTEIEAVRKTESGFAVDFSTGPVSCDSLVVALGGKSIPKMGATNLGYRLAEQFGLRVTETRPALVPLAFEPQTLEPIKALAGIAVDGAVACGKTRFAEPVLFTHRGLSGPSILQISSYWREGDAISVNLLPETDVMALLKTARASTPKLHLQTVLTQSLPKRLAQHFAELSGLAGAIGEYSDAKLRIIGDLLTNWSVRPVSTEGYRTAEVTLGGVDTRDLDAKTLMARDVPGLFFIGEVVDVTGWLGGYNFQWAWASGFCAGQAA